MGNNYLGDIKPMLDTCSNQLFKKVSAIMDRSGMFYRAFHRAKTPNSIEHKMSVKKYDEHHKMQDLFGVRIALYFRDDIPICKELIQSFFKVVDVSVDEPGEESFKPTRLNLVCKLPEDIKAQLECDHMNSLHIDDTFEIQIRTVFSEGWHEVEHDLRYKCKEDWNNEKEMSRVFNGIFATLETCDWSMISMFDELAYKKYKASEWSAMLRNKLRLRMVDNQISSKITEIMNTDASVAKDFLRLNRSEVVMLLSKDGVSQVPKNMDNIIFILNDFYIHNETIGKIEPDIIREKCEKVKGK